MINKGVKVICNKCGYVGLRSNLLFPDCKCGGQFKRMITRDDSRLKRAAQDYKNVNEGLISSNSSVQDVKVGFLPRSKEKHESPHHN